MKNSAAIQILDALRNAGGSLSKKDLVDSTGIPWASLCRTVDFLLSKGLIVSKNSEPFGRGRPKVPLSMLPDVAYFLGIDIGASHTKLIFLDLAFKPIYFSKIPTPKYSDSATFFSWLAEIFGRSLSESQIPKRKLRGIGLGISGTVDSEVGMIVSAGNLGMRRGANLPVSIFSSDCGVNVFAMSSKAASAWGEYHFGAKSFCGDLVSIDLGVGIGSGVVSNHQLLDSPPLRPIGYIGHILIPGNQRVCICGYKGCLESYSGGNSLIEVAKESIPENIQIHSAEALDMAASQGDEKAREILLKAASYNAVGIVSMIQLYSPEAIIFAGGQCKQDGFLYKNTIEAVKDALPEERRRNFSVSISSLGERRAALGAARLAYEKFLV